MEHVDRPKYSRVILNALIEDSCKSLHFPLFISMIRKLWKSTETIWLTDGFFSVKFGVFMVLGLSYLVIRIQIEFGIKYTVRRKQSDIARWPDTGNRIRDSRNAKTAAQQHGICYNGCSMSRDENGFSRITIMDGRMKFSYSYGSMLVGRFWFRRWRMGNKKPFC